MYQITNTLNGKIYVGVHKTNLLDDGYMGSGKILRSAMVKHGITNFSKVILEHFENQEAMYAKEAEIVNDEFLLREDVYNLHCGGYGGFDHINKDVPNRIAKNKKARESTNKILEEKYGENYCSVMGKLGGVKCKELKVGIYADDYVNPFKNPEIQQLGNSKEARKKAAVTAKKTFAEIKHQQGEKNSNFDKMWITNGEDSIKIMKTDNIPAGWRKGRVMQK